MWRPRSSARLAVGGHRPVPATAEHDRTRQRVRRDDPGGAGVADVKVHSAFAARAKINVTGVQPQPPRHLRDQEPVGERVAAAA